MIIYHSRGAYPGRLAAAIRVGLLPSAPPPDLAEALEQLGGPESPLQAEGLWAAGTDRQGRRVYALGRASRPDVVERAFRSLAQLAGIDSDCFALRAVGRPVAWSDLKVRVLRTLGLRGAADRAQLRGLRSAWREAAEAAGAGDGPTLRPPAAPSAPPGTTRNLIYFCYGGSHSSVTASNLHLGRLPGGRRARPGQILRQPLFDKAKKSELGIIRHMGEDEAGNVIHVVGLAGGKAVLSRALTDLLALCGLPVANFRFEPTLQNSGIILRLGGYVSRGLGWVAVGRPICVFGVWLKYPLYAAHVREVRRKLGLTGYRSSDIID